MLLIMIFFVVYPQVIFFQTGGGFTESLLTGTTSLRTSAFAIFGIIMNLRNTLEY